MCTILLYDVVWLSSVYGLSVFFFQAEDGIRDLVRSRGLGDVYKRQAHYADRRAVPGSHRGSAGHHGRHRPGAANPWPGACLLYTSDAADERSSVDLGGRRIIKNNTTMRPHGKPTRNIINK